MSSSERAWRARNRWLVAGGAIIVAALVVWGLLEPPDAPPPPTPPGSPASTEATGIPTECLGWVTSLAGDPVRLKSLSIPGMMALRGSKADEAIVHFAGLPPDSSESMAGLVRARSERALSLLRARDVALTAQRVFLDRRLALMSGREGEEIFPLLRAAVALQSGEPLDIAPILNQVSEKGPLAAARSFMLELAKAPLESTLPRPWAFARRWSQHASEYAKALESLSCPLPGAAARRSRELAGWMARGRMPTPDELDALDLGSPDFDFGGCDSDSSLRIEIYDTNIYTTLSTLATDELLQMKPGHPIGQFYQLITLTRVDPVGAQRQSCLLEKVFSAKPGHGGDGDDAYLVYGDWLDRTEIGEAVAGLCGGAVQNATCSPDTDGVRDRLERGIKWSEDCATKVDAQDPTAGEVVRSLHLYSGMVRRRFLEPYLAGQCGDRLSIEDHVFRLWRGLAAEGTRWESQEALLTWVSIDMALNRYQDGPDELSNLSSHNPLFVPLFEQVKRASVRQSGGPPQKIGN